MKNWGRNNRISSRKQKSLLLFYMGMTTFLLGGVVGLSFVDLVGFTTYSILAGCYLFFFWWTLTWPEELVN